MSSSVGPSVPSSLSASHLSDAIDCVPAWAREALSLASVVALADTPDAVIAGGTAGRFVVHAATWPAVAERTPAEFQAGVERIYAAILGDLRQRGLRAVRFWNFVPGINDDVGGLTRYMVFNAGRLNGYRSAYDDAGALPGAIATATGVGAPDEAFHVYSLATAATAMPVENPRQVPAYGYSRKYGPSPPSFARGMLLPGPDAILLVGGTSSVRGEDSVHQGDWRAQLEETLLNLGALVARAGECAAVPAQRDPLTTFVDLRAYAVDEALGPALCERLSSACGVPLASIEFRTAALCRPDLMIEVEGRADLGCRAGACGRPRG